MIKAIKIALLYWLQQALRPFCPHPNDAEARRYNAAVCPTCALWTRTYQSLNLLCGWKAQSELRKCEICFDPLSDRESGVHSRCADRERQATASRHGLRRVPEYDLPWHDSL